jgi:hypothetical protein
MAVHRADRMASARTNGWPKRTAVRARVRGNCESFYFQRLTLLGCTSHHITIALLRSVRTRSLGVEHVQIQGKRSASSPSSTAQPSPITSEVMTRPKPTLLSLKILKSR